MTLPAGTPIGKYVVRRKLAEGGMAEIFLCKATGAEGFEKEVVIKRVRPALAHDEQFVEMFISEAQLASRLNHPNVVQIYDFAKHEDTYYLAMEYIRGASLYDVRKRAREMMAAMPVALAAQLCMEVARGLHHAHKLTDRTGRALKLVHRDVTPHNILLSFDGAVKLTDFGIAKAGNKLSQAGSLKGKFAYMSPEQSRGDDIDARSDIFALGIVLWELLTGGRLFEADSDVALLRVVQTRAIVPPRRLNPDVPEALDRIVIKALDRDVANRFQTAQELERALWQVVAASAGTAEDTDLAAYLRHLYPEAEQAADPSRHTGAFAVPRAVEGAGSAPAETPRRQSTAVLSHKRAGTGPSEVPRAASWDDDGSASTHVVDRSASAAPAAPAGGAGAVGSTPPGAADATLVRARPGSPPAAPAGRRLVGPALFAAAGVLLVGGAAALVVTGGRPEPAPVSAGAPVEPAAVELPPVPRGGPSEGAAAPELQGEHASEAPPGEGTPAAPSAPAVAAAGAAQPAGATSDEGAAAIEGPTGAVELTLVPWADVTLQGQFHKNVMFKRTFVLPVGVHRIKLQHRNEVREYDVVIKRGQVVRKVERFRK